MKFGLLLSLAFTLLPFMAVAQGQPAPAAVPAAASPAPVTTTTPANNAQSASGANIYGLDEASGMPNDFYRYGLSIKGDNIRVELRVNDIGVLYKILRNGEELDFTFNEWLRKGNNYVEMRVDRFNDKQSYKLKFDFYFQSPTQITNDTRRSLFTSPGEMLLPWRQTLRIMVRTMPLLRLWQTEDFKLDDENKQFLLDAVNLQRVDLLTALTEANNNYLATFEKLIRDQHALAYGRLPENEKDIMSRREKIARSFSSQINLKPHVSEPLVLEELKFDLVADRKMVRLARKDGFPLISASVGDQSYVIERPIYGLIGGVWERLR